MSVTTDIEILRTGEFRDANGRVSKFDASALNEIRDSFASEGAKAPLVFGHPKDNAPAHGWVKSLRVEGNKLLARVGDISEDVRSLVKNKNFKYVSSSLFGRDSTANYAKGKQALRHIGLLGATAPAIPGLAPVELSADDNAITIQLTSEQAEVNPFQLQEDDMSDKEKESKDFAELKAENAKLRETIETLNKNFADERDAKNAQADKDFAEALVKEGKLADGKREVAVKMLGDARKAGDEALENVRAFMSDAEVVGKPNEKTQAPEVKETDGGVFLNPKEVRDYAEKNGVSIITATDELTAKRNKAQ